MRSVTAAAIALAAIMSLPAAAQDSPRPVLDAVIKACGADIKQFCKDVEPGGGRVMKCLRDHEDKLSQSCKDFFAEARGKIERKSKAPE